MKWTAALIVALLASCGERYEPGYGGVYYDPEVAGEWITETVRAANPMSDEEPEDNIAQAERTATGLFQRTVPGMWDTNRRPWRFTPLYDCTPQHRAIVEEWMGKPSEGGPPQSRGGRE